MFFQSFMHLGEMAVLSPGIVGGSITDDRWTDLYIISQWLLGIFTCACALGIIISIYGNESQRSVGAITTTVRILRTTPILSPNTHSLFPYNNQFPPAHTQLMEHYVGVQDRVKP